MLELISLLSMLETKITGHLLTFLNGSCFPQICSKRCYKRKYLLAKALWESNSRRVVITRWISCSLGDGKRRLRLSAWRSALLGTQKPPIPFSLTTIETTIYLSKSKYPHSIRAQQDASKNYHHLKIDPLRLHHIAYRLPQGRPEVDRFARAWV